MIPYPFYDPNKPVGIDYDNSNTVSRGYGAFNQTPQAMNPQPTSMSQPYNNQLPMAGYSPTYAHGGTVNNLQNMSEYLRRAGQGGDTVLAHLSPEEAMELKQKYGGDINPITGLPQFGLFRKIFPVIASAIGYMVGGPQGAMIAGGISRGGMEAGRHKNHFKGFLKGGLEGAGIGAATAFGGNALGIQGGGGSSGLFSALKGLGSAPTGRETAMQGLKNLATPGSSAAKASSSSGLFSGLGDKLSGIWNNSDSLEKGLLGTAILGTLLGKRSKSTPLKTYSEGDAILQPPEWRKDQMPGNISPLFREMNRTPYDAYQAGYIPEYSNFGNYAHGGSVAQYYHGGAGGQDDNLDAHVQEGDYIWDADSTAAYGDGNTINGAIKLMQDAERIGGQSSSPLFSHLQPNAKLSPAEVKWDKSVVTKIGGGSNAKGAKILDKAREKMRAHKRSAPINKIPPKAKTISEYMLGGRV